MRGEEGAGGGEWEGMRMEEEKSRGEESRGGGKWGEEESGGAEWEGRWRRG